MQILCSLLIGFLFILLSVIYWEGSQAFPGWRALFPVLGSAMILVSGPNAWLNRNVLAWRPVVWIGLISYPLYLWHWPLLAFARLSRVGGLSPAEAIVLVCIAFLLATLTYQFIEQPLRHSRRILHLRTTPVLVVIMLFIFLSGRVVVKTTAARLALFTRS